MRNMTTIEELQQIVNLASELNQNVAKHQTETNAKNMREIVEKQTEVTQQILDTLLKQLEEISERSEQNERKKILTKNLIRPDKFSEPTRYISINRFVKTYCDFVDRICDKENGEYAQYFRSFLDGPAAIWYNANVDDNMSDNFDAIISAMQTRFERESYKAYSYMPQQNDKTVTEFYDELLKIGIAQCWSTERQLDLFRSGIADRYKLSLDSRCPKSLTEAYNMALVIEADKTDNLNMEEMNSKMIQMLMETVEKLNAAQKAINEKEENYTKIATEETPQSWNNDANRLHILENSITQISEMLFQQQMMINQNCLTQYPYEYPLQCPQPYDYPPQCPRPADPSYEMPQNFNYQNPRYQGRNYDPGYVPKHKRPSPSQNQAQSKRKRNQENEHVRPIAGPLARTTRKLRLTNQSKRLSM